LNLYFLTIDLISSCDINTSLLDTYNAPLRGKLWLAKISDEGANSQLLFVLLEWLVSCLYAHY
jgi:hypothetical protein